MTKEQERNVLVALAVVGAVHEIISRQRVVTAACKGGEISSRAQAYHGAMTFYRRAAEWFGRRALEAEAHYWREVADGGR